MTRFVVKAMVLTALRLDTGARILDAAFERILDVGLARATVEDVARAAGLSRQTIYRYHPSKDALAAALVMREEERFLDGVREAAADEDIAREIERRGGSAYGATAAPAGIDPGRARDVQQAIERGAEG